MPVIFNALPTSRTRAFARAYICTRMPTKQICQEVILGSCRCLLGMQETKHSCPALWLPSTLVLVIHPGSTRFLNDGPHLDSQVLKCRWRTETEGEMGYKKGRETDQGAKISKRRGGGGHPTKTPQKWAACCDDVEVGCDLEGRGESAQPDGVRVGCHAPAFSQSRRD